MRASSKSLDLATSSLSKDKIRYMLAKQRIDKIKDNIEEFQEIKEYLLSNEINAFKYNTSLDESVQNFCSYEAIIEVTNDGKSLNIYNKKPIDRTEYTLEADPEKLKIQKEAFKQSSKGQIQYVISKSSTSCDVSDIRGIMFGGTSSRFWMLRKHFNMLT